MASSFYKSIIELDPQYVRYFPLIREAIISPAGRSGGTERYLLYRNSCLVKDMSEPNCTIACADHASIYQSANVLMSCLVAPYVVTNLSRHDDSWYSEANDIGIDAYFISHSNYSSNIIRCFGSACGNSEECKACDWKIDANNIISGIQDFGRCFAALCSEEPSTINPDIGGIGVSEQPSQRGLQN